jgi:MarR family transcriptional regulator, organic hydroperoxide resistance regulator
MGDSSFDSLTWRNLYLALVNLDQVYTRVIDGLDLTMVEAYVLWSLNEKDGQRATDLGREVGREATSFTPILDKIEERGLLERRNNPADRRSVLIYLTPEGHKVSQKLVSLFKATEATISERIGNDQLTRFLDVVKVLQNIRKMPASSHTNNAQVITI